MKIQGAAHRLKEAARLTLDKQETRAKPETLGELQVPAHPDPSQRQEAADRNEAEEAREGVKRANTLRYKEYLGMAKMERQVIRELI